MEVVHVAHTWKWRKKQKKKEENDEEGEEAVPLVRRNWRQGCDDSSSLDSGGHSSFFIISSLEREATFSRVHMETRDAKSRLLRSLALIGTNFTQLLLLASSSLICVFVYVHILFPLFFIFLPSSLSNYSVFSSPVSDNYNLHPKRVISVLLSCFNNSTHSFLRPVFLYDLHFLKNIPCHSCVKYFYSFFKYPVYNLPPQLYLNY